MKNKNIKLIYLDKSCYNDTDTSNQEKRLQIIFQKIKDFKSLFYFRYYVLSFKKNEEFEKMVLNNLLSYYDNGCQVIGI